VDPRALLDAVVKRKIPSPRRESNPRTILSVVLRKYETWYLTVKVKVSLCLTKHHAMKTYWWSEGIAACIL